MSENTYSPLSSPDEEEVAGSYSLWNGQDGEMDDGYLRVGEDAEGFEGGR